MVLIRSYGKSRFSTKRAKDCAFLGFVFLFILTNYTLGDVLTNVKVEKPLVVGVLENSQINNSSRQPAIRALFLKKRDGWIALDSATSAKNVIPMELEWTVTLNERSLGTVKTVDPGADPTPPWTFPRDRLFPLSSDQVIPTVPNRSGSFESWEGTPVYRPLVVVSRPNFTDTDHWKPVNPNQKLISRFLPFFKEFSTVPCTLHDLVVQKCYRDKEGRRLVAIKLNPKLNKDEGPLEGPFEVHEFLVTEKITWLGAGLELIDAGDYDLDGKSELLFWFSGYNQDGYTLFSDNFNNKTTFRWQYH